MLLAYLTHDDVNLDFAFRLAEAAGLRLFPLSLSLKEKALTHAFDAVLYDLDFLPLDARQQILTELMDGGASGVAAVHSYALEQDLTTPLRAAGVGVHSRLDRGVFAAIARRIKQTRNRVPDARKGFMDA